MQGKRKHLRESSGNIGDILGSASVIVWVCPHCEVWGWIVCTDDLVDDWSECQVHHDDYNRHTVEMLTIDNCQRKVLTSGFEGVLA